MSKANKIKSSIKDFPIVGIGASAGGLEALELFFNNISSKNGMAFVVIQHLDPTHKGIMPELLQRITKMKVTQASDGIKVKPNCVFVIPPNKSMSLLKSTLHLFDPVESRGLRLPIDIFFRSMAEDKLDKSIGIILSGMGSDGSLGLKAIKEKNGLVLVQTPDSAKFDGMPRSAVDSVIADVVAPVEDLPAKLIDLLNFIPQNKPDRIFDIKDKNNLDKIIILIREQTGHDFSSYKKNTLYRRIERRKSIHQIDKINHYVRFLQENPKEIEILFKELLIGVTNFFRDNAVWQMFKESVLPDLIKTLPEGYVLRAWIPACSTGEEAYTLAIVFKEVMEKFKKKKRITLQIFATDIDNDAVDKARKGCFSKNITGDVSEERLNRFFVNENDGYRICSEIREMVVFAFQSIIKDPPFTNIDIISCRNLLIYLETSLQKKIVSLFHYSLNTGGVMILGTSETTGTNDEMFEIIDNKLKIYKKTASIKSPDLIDFPSSFHHKRNLPVISKTEKKFEENIQSLTDKIIIEKFSPASVLINRNGDILYMTGKIGKYLEPVAGKANWNVYAMGREGLNQLLPGAIRKAVKTKDPIVLQKIKIGINGGSLFVDVKIQQIDSNDSINGMILLAFNDLPLIEDHSKLHKTDTKTKPSKRVKELELELQNSYEENQNIREEMQTSQEELQSTNEELQSTNEELTTSKEEMQSLNEELQTVNIELQSKVSDFIQANDDLKNLLNSTEIATLFLDRDLKIRRFTDPVTKIFKLIKTDIGRPFTDLATQLKYPEIDEHSRKVIKTLSTIETAISTKDKKWFNIRIMPYRTLDDRIDGLVMTFTDITIAKKLEFKLKEANKAVKIKKKQNKGSNHE